MNIGQMISNPKFPLIKNARAASMMPLENDCCPALGRVSRGAASLRRVPRPVTLLMESGKICLRHCLDAKTYLRQWLCHYNYPLSTVQDSLGIRIV